MSETTETPLAGRLENMGMVDLRSAKTAEDLKGITSIHNAGCVLVPEHLATVALQIPMENVGTVIPLPEGANVKVHVGQITMTGEALAAGDPEAILFIAGQLILTTPVTAVGFKEVRIHGQIMAIRGSETALGSKLGEITGQVLYLPAKARTMMGQETIGKEFLELLPEPVPIVVMGELTIEDDVTVELLKSKVPEFVLMGHISVPKALLPLVQVLTVEKMGEISAK